MIIGTVLAIAALAAVIFMLYLVRGGERTVRSMEELVARSRPVDLEAFRNLVSSSEEEFLRAHLDAQAFRQVQRTRLRAATEYARRTSHNAALLLQVARMARQAKSADAQQAAEDLLNSALKMRIYSMLAICLFQVRILSPGLRIRPVTIVDRYEGLRSNVSGLLRLQVPAAVSQVDAAL